MGLHQVLLYVSDLATKAPLDTVATIARQSRVNNERKGITGLLVFDGECFAQFLDGPTESIAALQEHLKADRRHERMEVLHSGPHAGVPRFPGWRLGYLLMDLQEFGLASLRGKRDAAAMEAFEFMLPALDISVGEDIPRDRIESAKAQRRHS